MADGLLNAFWRGLLGQTANATTEVAKNEDEVCRRLILSGMTVSSAGVITVPGLTFGTVTVPGGGTGVVTLAAHGVLVGEGASNVAVTTPGTSGQLFISNGAAVDPSFQTPTVAQLLTNTGTTTTVLHGNAAGVPAYTAIVGNDITNATIDLTTKVTGVLPVANGGTNGLLPVANGGTNLASGTSGGVLAYTAAGVLASSAALASTALVLGGGAGAVPVTNANWTINASSILNSSTQPRCQVFHNTTQTLTTAVEAAALFNSEDHDVGAMHDTGSNTSRITIPTGGDGTYLLGGTATLANAANSFRCYWKKNGTTSVSTVTIGTQVGGGSPAGVTSLCLVTAVATDFFELFLLQDSGGNANAGSATRNQSNQAFALKVC